MPSIHDTVEVERFCRERRMDADRLRQLRNAFYKKALGPSGALAKLPAEYRGEFEEQFEFYTLRLESRHDSRLDGASKLIFRTQAGLLVEAVILRIASGRTSLCVSSQVGCAAGCEFCATGKMGLVRNLTAAEILDQVQQASELLKAEGRRLRNLVFMGMGEPLHNEPLLYEALDVLRSPRCFDLASQRTLVSTVGIPAAMVRLARRFPDARLALSLHSARQEVREQLMPIARRVPLGELRAALDEVAALHRRPVMIEYLLLRDRNDMPADLAALVDYLRGLPVHINLIPYNPIAAAPGLESTPDARRMAFAGALKSAGFSVTIRYSLGADVAAACGQLVQERSMH